MSVADLNEFFTLCYRRQVSRPHERFGQVMMNVLRDELPDLYEEATSSPFDPFYVDSFSFAFLDWLAGRFAEVAGEADGNHGT